MSFIKLLESEISKILVSLGYEDNVALLVSNRPDLGDYQYNGCMKLSSIYKEKPIDIANKIVEKLNQTNYFKSINIAGPGFINLSFSDEALIEYMNEIFNNFEINNYKVEKKLVFLDYGGANIAKELHVGHLRSANIGEALKRLLNNCGVKTISDVHLGDWGTPMGLVMNEIKHMKPDLPYFDENYDGVYPKESPVTESDLAYIYPMASKKKKESETYASEARELTQKLQNKDKGLIALWKHIVNTSSIDIKRVYEDLGASFDLWLGESDADPYIDEVLNLLDKKGLTYISDGALVMDVCEDEDKLEIPPILLKKTDGSILYASTEMATLYMRIKEYNPSEFWYIVDNRQELHFKQVFRAAKKSGLVNENVGLYFLGFGTMNGSDGKPFKTRDGGVMSLKSLIELVKSETIKKINDNITDKEALAKDLAIATIKYADLLPNRSTDYIFDPIKFSDLNGKTAPYLLYSTVRMKSLLNKSLEEKIGYKKYNILKTDLERNVILNLLEVPKVLENSLNSKSLNEIAEYLYKLTNNYNNFYASNKVLIEKDTKVRESWLVLTELVYKTNKMLLNILGITVPDKI